MDQLPLIQVEQAETLAALGRLALPVLAGLLEPDLLRRPPAVRLLTQRRRDHERLRVVVAEPPLAEQVHRVADVRRRTVRKVKKPRTLIA
jgi:hypothetical protein